MPHTNDTNEKDSSYRKNAHESDDQKKERTQHQSKNQDQGFENPWQNVFKNMAQPKFDNWKDFSNQIVDGLMDFYKKTMEFNPLLKPAMEQIQKNSELFAQISSSPQSTIMTEINSVAAKMLQALIEKQQKYLAQLFSKISKEHWTNPSGLMDLTQEYFMDLSNLILKTNEEINDLLCCLCNSLDKQSNPSDQSCKQEEAQSDFSEVWKERL